MKTLKSLFMVLALIIGVGTASAHSEEGTHGIGINFGYGVGSYGMNNLGLGIRYNYQLSDNIRIQPSFLYYFDTDKFEEKDISFDLHYLFNMNDDKMHFYPVFGITTLFGQENYKKEEMDAFFRFGVNLGAGLQIDLTDDFALIGEARYKLVKGMDNVNFAVGCLMTF